jgi:reactive intermediate/imine deaminase
MMENEIRFVNADTLTAPNGHYSHAVCANGFVFVSGNLPTMPDGCKMTGEPFEVQAQQVMSNITHVLRACNSDISLLVQVRVYLRDINNWPLFNCLYAKWIGDVRPARCVVPVPELHYELDLEMEVVALQNPEATGQTENKAEAPSIRKSRGGLIDTLTKEG